MSTINSLLFSIIALDESKTTLFFKIFTKVLQNIILNISLPIYVEKIMSYSVDKQLPRKNSLILIDIQEKKTAAA